MKHRYRATERFWTSFYRLNASQKEASRAAWKIFKANPFDPRLRAHKVQRLSAHYSRTIYAAQALWSSAMGGNPSGFKGPLRPVERVSWDECQDFVRKVNQQLPGLNLGLPGENESEYACRAGSRAARYAEDLDSIAWHGGNSGGQTHDVAEKLSNSWGLYDMLGNVWEWCYDASSPTSAYRVIRGGSWAFSAR